MIMALVGNKRLDDGRSSVLSGKQYNLMDLLSLH